MYPTHERFRAFSRLALAVALASPGLAAQERVLDPAALDFAYATPEVHRALDRTGLKSLENAPDHNPITDAGARLGRVLFYDRQLSRTGTTACASCHLQERAFADPSPTSRGFRGKRTRRNSMALANLAYYSSGKFFWDERGATLEEMVLMPIQDEVEMGMGLREVALRLQDDASYRWLFRNAFGDSEVTTDRIAFALAQFLRSMVSLSSKFDEGLALSGSIEKGFPNFTDEENLGKSLFFGLAHTRRSNSCASCHVREPAAQTGPSEEVAGGGAGAGDGATAVAQRPAPRRPLPIVFQGSEPTNNGIDRGLERDDAGLGAITGEAADRGKFKAPSLRNVALTGPYMHDGRFSTLRAVVEHYSESIHPHANLDARLRPGGGGWGGGSGPRRRPPPKAEPEFPRGHPLGDPPRTTGSALPPARTSSGSRGLSGFDFTRAEKAALVAFLETLTDERFVTDPKFSDPFE